LEKDIDLVIIGCGDYSCIKYYVEETDAKFPIYSNPTASLFKTFELGKNLEVGPRNPDYMATYGIWSGLRKTTGHGLLAGVNPFKAGDMKQLGGE
jgi:AhpC/TSA antioxidant enzyme